MWINMAYKWKTFRKSCIYTHFRMISYPHPIIQAGLKIGSFYLIIDLFRNDKTKEFHDLQIK